MEMRNTIVVVAQKHGHRLLGAYNALVVVTLCSKASPPRLQGTYNNYSSVAIDKRVASGPTPCIQWRRPCLALWYKWWYQRRWQQ
jgi:hypothetical protein